MVRIVIILCSFHYNVNGHVVYPDSPVVAVQ